MKFQKTEGSVDEKLQSGPFKKIMYEKLMKNEFQNINDKSDVTVTYTYFLSSWFNQQSNVDKNKKYYHDVYEYMNSNGVRCNINKDKANTLFKDLNGNAFNVVDFLKN